MNKEQIMNEKLKQLHNLHKPMQMQFNIEIKKDMDG